MKKPILGFQITPPKNMGSAVEKLIKIDADFNTTIDKILENGTGYFFIDPSPWQDLPGDHAQAGDVIFIDYSMPIRFVPKNDLFTLHQLGSLFSTPPLHICYP